MNLPTAKEVYLKASEISPEHIDEAKFIATWEQLSNREKEIMYLHHIEKLSYNEIDERLKITKPKIQSSIARFLKRNE